MTGSGLDWLDVGWVDVSLGGSLLDGYDWMLGGWTDRCMMSYYKKTIITTTLRH